MTGRKFGLFSATVTPIDQSEKAWSNQPHAGVEPEPGPEPSQDRQSSMASQSHSQTGDRPSPAKDPLQVLVVDDDPEQVTEIAEYLSRKGLSVRTAENGLVALDLVREFEPAIVVMDINMPDMRGDRISEILTSLDHRAAVILMSGYPDLYDRVSERADGVVAVLQKPVSLKALFDTIGAVITL